MNEEAVLQAQAYLTVSYEDMPRQIVNVELLLKRHGTDAVLAFLERLQEEYRKKLASLIRRDKTDLRINEVVARRFRIRMAINTIKNARREVKAA